MLIARFAFSTVGTTYHYAVATINQSGKSDQSTEVIATPSAAGALPDGWKSDDIGNPTVEGHDAYSPAGRETFVISGEGHGVGGDADGCHFVYKPVEGDFTITARLIEKSGRVSKVGLMMRESIGKSAPTLALTVGEIGGRQTRFGTRAAAGARWTVQNGNDYTGVPIWFRLQRNGNTFTASQSPDGVSWYIIGTSAASLAKQYLAGFAATSATDKGDLANLTVDNVRVEVAPPAVPPAPADLHAEANANSITLNWKTASASGYRIECSRDGKLFYEIADLPDSAVSFVNTGLAAKTYWYRVRAYNTGGFSGYSGVESAAIRAPTATTLPAAQ